MSGVDGDDDEGWETIQQLKEGEGTEDGEHSMKSDDVARLVFHNEMVSKQHNDQGWVFGRNHSLKERSKDPFVQTLVVSDASGVVVGGKVMKEGFHCWKINVDSMGDEPVSVGVLWDKNKEQQDQQDDESCLFAFQSDGSVWALGKRLDWFGTPFVAGDQLIVELDLVKMLFRVSFDGVSGAFVELASVGQQQEMTEQSEEPSDESTSEETESTCVEPEFNPATAVFRPAIFIHPADTISIEWIESSFPSVQEMMTEDYTDEQKLERMQAELEIATMRIQQLEETVVLLRDENSELKVQMCVLEEQLAEQQQQ